MTEAFEPVDPTQHSNVLDRKPRLIPGPPINPLLSGFFCVSLHFPDDPIAHVPESYWDDDALGVENVIGKYVPANQQHWRPQCMTIQDAIAKDKWHVLSRWYAKSLGATPCPDCYTGG